MNSEFYSKELMESAKTFAHMAKAMTQKHAKQAFLRSSFHHSFCFLESHINFITSSFQSTKQLDVSTLGFLQEKEVVLSKGDFIVSKKDRYYSLIDRIEFLIHRFGGDAEKESFQKLKSDLARLIRVRNDLTHPREANELADKDAEEAMLVILDTTDIIYRAVFKKGLPYTKLGIDKKVDFS